MTTPNENDCSNCGDLRGEVSITIPCPSCGMPTRIVKAQRIARMLGLPVYRGSVHFNGKSVPLLRFYFDMEVLIHS
jgi:hypothetical protein